ncbi:MAG: hypothetical protein AAFX40_06820 [Cyanobacteria bacterium J06639_1]
MKLWTVQAIAVVNGLSLLAAVPALGQSVEKRVEEAARSALTRVKLAQASSDTAAASDAAEERSDRINYVGIGGTLGLADEGETAFGEGGFSLLGKVSLTERLSIHNASVFGDRAISSFALTRNRPIRERDSSRMRYVPFVGAGLTIETDEFDIDPMLATGIDIPLANHWAGTTRLNVAFDESGADIGLSVGIGYDLRRLFFGR